ncbi:MAG TPA: VOC family protein [Candidatus Dormibacteraeota bacterium]|nr:VOC family protein [Candidatus Dormibacteraeota bacterium]
MLSESLVHATLPCQDRDRARAFYADKLGLTPSAEEPAALTYEMPGGTRFILFTSSGKPSGEHTQVGFRVKDIESEVRQLKDNGVQFEEYDFPGFDKSTGVATTGAIRSAWFKDTEGNVLGLVQLPE